MNEDRGIIRKRNPYSSGVKEQQKFDKDREIPETEAGLSKSGVRESFCQAVLSFFYRILRYEREENIDDELNFIDKFGVTIMSRNCRNGEGTLCCQHFFVDVEQNGPAHEMHIRNKDEIVLINGTSLVQNESHCQVVELFKHAAVDGKSRFSIVLRRRIESDAVRMFDTSAVFRTSRSTGERAVAEDVHSCQLSEKGADTSKCRLKVTGTQEYLTVANGRVFADVLKNDDSDAGKTISKENKYCLNSKSCVEFVTSLQSEKGDYIAISDGKVTLQDEAEEFLYGTEGCLIYFRQNDDDSLYLAGGQAPNEIIAGHSVFYFEEFPLQESGAM